MSWRALAAFLLLALGATACPPENPVYRWYEVENPDDQLAAMGSACRATPGPPAPCYPTVAAPLACVSDACIAVCKHLMVIGGDGAHQDQLSWCDVQFPADAGSVISAYVAYDLRK